jgi:hypothetical protein
MNIDNYLIPGFSFLKDYEFYSLTADDIIQIKEGEFLDTLLPIPMDKMIFSILGFQYCLDNFGNGFYFKGLGINIWQDQKTKCFYYKGKDFTYSFPGFHDFQYFLRKYLGKEILYSDKISSYINDHYSMERRLALMSPKERHEELDNRYVLKLWHIPEDNPS